MVQKFTTNFNAQYQNEMFKKRKALNYCKKASANRSNNKSDDTGPITRDAPTRDATQRDLILRAWSRSPRLSSTHVRVSPGGQSWQKQGTQQFRALTRCGSCGFPTVPVRPAAHSVAAVGACQAVASPILPCCPNHFIGASLGDGVTLGVVPRGTTTAETSALKLGHVGVTCTVPAPLCSIIFNPRTRPYLQSSFRSLVSSLHRQSSKSSGSADQQTKISLMFIHGLERQDNSFATICLM